MSEVGPRASEDWEQAIDALACPAGWGLARLLRTCAAADGLWVVGGAVRDLLLGRTPGDLDLISPRPRALVERLCDQAGGRAVVLDERLPTVRWVLPRARDEAPAVISYLDVSGLTGDSLSEDLAARDLTINALAVSLHQARAPALVDEQDGMADLVARRARVISRANLVADPLRVLRLHRCAAELGLTLDEDSARWAAELAPQLGSVAPERSRLEWLRTLEVGHSVASHGDYLPVFAPHVLLGLGPEALTPEAWSEALACDVRLCSLAVGKAEGPSRLLSTWRASATHLSGPLGWLRTMLLISLGTPPRTGLREALLARRFTRQESRHLEAVLALRGLEEPLAQGRLGDEEAEVVGRLGRSPELLAAALLCSWARGGLVGKALGCLLLSCSEDRTAPWLDGASLRAAGLRPGPRFGRLLDQSLGYQLTGRWSDAAGARRWLEREVGT